MNRFPSSNYGYLIAVDVDMLYDEEPALFVTLGSAPLDINACAVETLLLETAL